jgi:hypothetical protein
MYISTERQPRAAGGGAGAGGYAHSHGAHGAAGGQALLGGLGDQGGGESAALRETGGRRSRSLGGGAAAGRGGGGCDASDGGGEAGHGAERVKRVKAQRRTQTADGTSRCNWRAYHHGHHGACRSSTAPPSIEPPRADRCGLLSVLGEEVVARARSVSE